MGLYISPDYFQTVHYYFFCLGIISFTSIFMFWGFGIYSYIFIAFYVAHSAISWYVSWFMFTRMKQIFIINTFRYAISHTILTIWSGGLSVLLWYMAAEYFEAMLTSMVMVNFFAVFMGAIWYLLSRWKLMDSFFDWMQSGDLRKGKAVMHDFRKKSGLKLVDDDIIDNYLWGTDNTIDRLFLLAKKQRDEKLKSVIPDTIRDLEIALTELRIRELDKRISGMEGAASSETDKQLLSTYKNLIKSYTHKISSYQDNFRNKFPK
ncbi:MAG: hypothetical protein JXC85_06485 [Candidatus Aenigmarchaeota archaeon]|nr:hypothetical protein [Candidatus Aenigmarchaeota archaeon]